MDKNGIVTVTSNAGSAEGRALAQEMLTPTASPTEWSFSQLLNGIMGALTTAALAVITYSRKVIFTDDANAKTNIGGELPGGDYLEIKPEAGQESRSLTWELGTAGSLELWTAPMKAAAEAAVGEIIDPVKPKLSAESLAEKLLAIVDSNNGPVFRTVVVDQANKKILAFAADATADLLDVVETATGNTAVLTVDGDSTPDDPTADKLPFEGGAV